MKDNIISFIFCVNNEALFNNAVNFISELKIPDGFEIEIIKITNAKSITSGYNEGMRKSNGKYKVYLHQDVYIINQNFIYNILDIFKNEQIGLIGFAGSKEIPSTLIWWEAPNLFGKVYEIRNSNMRELSFNNPINTYEEVSLLDGFMLVSQYDVNWREDVFDGWHYYDISQCIEFLKVGKKVVIPNQNTPWAIHDCGIVSVDNFEKYRHKLYEEYFKK